MQGMLRPLQYLRARQSHPEVFQPLSLPAWRHTLIRSPIAMLTFDSTSSLLNYVPSCSTGFETGASASAGIKVKGQKLSRHICIMQINRKSYQLQVKEVYSLTICLEALSWTILETACLLRRPFFLFATSLGFRPDLRWHRGWPQWCILT